MKTLVITNRKGGVGKSTFAVHAAWFFAEKMRVLVLETDPQRNASSTLEGAVCGVSMSDMMTKTVTLPRLDGPGLIVVAADDEVNNLAHRQDDPMQQFIKNVQAIEAGGAFDICIIDTPPAANYLNIIALVVATHAIAPIDMNQYAIDGLTALLKQIVGVKQQMNPKLVFLGLLPNQYSSGIPSQKQALHDLMAAFGGQYMFKGVIGKRQAYSDATAEKIPAWQIQKTAAREAGREIKRVLSQVDDLMFAVQE